mmetsp:Transcript_46445/g.41489  ORF Transcript_46445/g.41489 Transcript_46445/m.41489 type:complete len:166 (+) Transcript_46445:79-576(+)
MFPAIISLLIVSIEARTYCNYRASTDQITCWGPTETVTCSSVHDPTYSLPKGEYWIGPATTSHWGGWFNLYPINGDRIWDYHTKVPAFDCEGGFALHEGSRTLGCITITDNQCWDRLYRQIFSSTITRTMDECSGCFCLVGCRCGLGQSQGSVQRQTYDAMVTSL